MISASSFSASRSSVDRHGLTALRHRTADDAEIRRENHTLELEIGRKADHI
jgi:hypothetical protein